MNITAQDIKSIEISPTKKLSISKDFITYIEIETEDSGRIIISLMAREKDNLKIIRTS